MDWESDCTQTMAEQADLPDPANPADAADAIRQIALVAAGEPETDSPQLWCCWRTRGPHH